MYVGSKYDSSRDITEVAKCFRAEVVTAKSLPPDAPFALPMGLKLGVRARRFAGGRSLDITVKEYPGPLVNPAALLFARLLPYEPRTLPWYTKEAARVLDVLQRLSNLYNFDKSETQSDYFHVGFYVSVDVAPDCEERHRQLLARAEAPYAAVGLRCLELQGDLAITVAAGLRSQAVAQLETLNEGYASYGEQSRALRAMRTSSGTAPPTTAEAR